MEDLATRLLSDPEFYGFVTRLLGMCAGTMILFNVIFCIIAPKAVKWLAVRLLYERVYKRFIKPRLPERPHPRPSGRKTAPTVKTEDPPITAKEDSDGIDILDSSFSRDMQYP